jgi:hypothetical protein
MQLCRNLFRHERMRHLLRVDFIICANVIQVIFPRTGRYRDRSGNHFEVR